MNSLDLHLEDEVSLPYKLYSGSAGNIQEKLQQLRSEHRSPIGALHFINRLKEIETHPKVLEEWNNLCPTLGDAIARHPYESARIIRGNIGLWNYIAKHKLREGVIELRGTAYDHAGGLHVPGFRVIKKSVNEEEIFFYLGLEKDQSAGQGVSFPKAKDFPYLTLLAFNNSARVLGSSRLDENGCLIGIR